MTHSVFSVQLVEHKDTEEVKTSERHVFVLNNKDKYHVRRINIALEQKGIRVSLRTVYRTMSEMGILHRRRTRRGTTKATIEIQDRENLIKRDFKAEKPLRKLLSDITEIQCCDGKLYVSAVLDCYNGEILSAAMDSNMKKEKIYRIPAYRLTRDQVKSIIFRYIFVYYNRIRISSVNPGGLSPAVYREWARAPTVA